MKVRAVVFAVVLGVGTCVASAQPAEAGGRTIKIGDAHAAEGRVLLFPVTLSRTAPHKVAVDFTTVEGSANDNDDYIGRGGTLTFRPGVKKRILAIATNTDPRDEEDETIAVVLSSPRKATLSRSQATGTIADDDAPPVIHIADSTAEERDGTLRFAVTLSDESGRVASVDYATTDGTATAGTDYTSARGTITFAPGVTESAIDVPVAEDGVSETQEWFGARLSGPTNAVLGTTDAQGWIEDSGAPLPEVSIADAETPEGAAGTTTTLTFDVALSAPSPSETTVDVATVAGTAHDQGISVSGGNDFVYTTGTVRFAPGQTTARFSVPVNGDDVDEDDSETFTVLLRDPSNVVIADGEAIGTITDDDAMPTLWIDDVVGNEPRSGERVFTFNVTLSAPSGHHVTVDFATADGSAHAPGDYAATAGTLQLVPGSTIATVDVVVRADRRAESGETFNVTLDGPINAGLARAQAMGKIRTND